MDDRVTYEIESDRFMCRGFPEPRSSLTENLRTLQLTVSTTTDRLSSFDAKSGLEVNLHYIRKDEKIVDATCILSRDGGVYLDNLKTFNPRKKEWNTEVDLGYQELQKYGRVIRRILNAAPDDYLTALFLRDHLGMRELTGD